ncbi:TPA: aminotransferase class I/II-fold pyridoxal phosphate-dependent enzyme [Vibrio vulnificus]
MIGPFSKLSDLYFGEIDCNDFYYKCHFGSPIMPPTYDVINDFNVFLKKEGSLFSEYPEPRCIDSLRDAIKKYISKISYSCNITNVDMLVTSGTREAINSFVVFAKNKNKEKKYAIIPSPCYPGYVGSCKYNDLEVISVPLNLDNNFQPQLSNLSKDILENTALIILTNPGNPFTYYLSRDSLDEVLAISEEFGIECLVDECFFDLQVDNKITPISATSYLKDCDFLTVIHSLSKRSSSAGLRSGFILSTREKINQIANVRSLISPTVPNIIQHVSANLWNDNVHVEDEIKSIVDKIDITKDYLGDWAIYPEAGFFVNLKTSDELKLTRILYRKGIKSMPISFMRHSEVNRNIVATEGYVRIGLVYDKEDIVKICKTISDIYKENDVL